MAEALKVAGMDKDAKEKYEQEQAEEKMAKREADIARRELKADAREVLAEKQIPTEFLDMLLGSDLKENQSECRQPLKQSLTLRYRRRWKSVWQVRRRRAQWQPVRDKHEIRD